MHTSLHSILYCTSKICTHLTLVKNFQASQILCPHTTDFTTCTFLHVYLCTTGVMYLFQRVWKRAFLALALTDLGSINGIFGILGLSGSFFSTLGFLFTFSLDSVKIINSIICRINIIVITYRRLNMFNHNGYTLKVHKALSMYRTVVIEHKEIRYLNISIYQQSHHLDKTLNTHITHIHTSHETKLGTPLC